MLHIHRTVFIGLSGFYFAEKVNASKLSDRRLRLCMTPGDENKWLKLLDMHLSAEQQG